MIFQRLKNHYEFISAKLTEIEKQLSHLPPGQLNCWSVNGQSKYYLSQNHKRTYLSSKNEFLIFNCFAKRTFSRRKSLATLYPFYANAAFLSY